MVHNKICFLANEVEVIFDSEDNLTFEELNDMMNWKKNLKSWENSILFSRKSMDVIAIKLITYSS